jgi:hypothetical protein
MPYKVEDSKEDPGEFDVVNSETGDVKDTFETREEAQRMCDTLRDMEKEGDDDE